MNAISPSASELNKSSDKVIINNDDSSEHLLGNGLIARRPTALSLTPIETNVPIPDSEVDAESTSSYTYTQRQSVQRIDVAFSNLTYSVSSGLFTKKNKTVLNELNGEFKSGEITAIMGPSGAGKSTLMDILAGYTTYNVHGHVTINGRERDLKSFRRKSAYIMQDHELEPHITVMEAMHFSANLKIGSEISPTDKKIRIKQILVAIGLYEHRKTRSGLLSGGQKKRLAIALEIVNNPPVMFFDEPTSGLDSSTSTQVILLLKKLAQEGRTVIVTIHQPSALVFGLFDHLFTVAEGKCIYTGATQSLVPFLAELNLICPEHYNPTDYLLEISTHDYGNQNDRLIEHSKNGKETAYRKKRSNSADKMILERAEKLTSSGLITPVTAPPLPQCKQPLSPLAEMTIDKFQKFAKFKKNGYCPYSETYATTFCKQVILLLSRRFLVLWRDRSLAMQRIVMHILIAILVGILYMGIGNDASNALNNVRYIFLSIMFVMFSAYSATIITFPLELPIITREHFNRWYSLKAYYVAMTLADAPLQVACILLYICITYFSTCQPLELFRITLFSTILILTSFVAISLSLIVASIFSMKFSPILGSFIICPFVVCSGFFVHLAHTHYALHWIFHISFLKYALEGAMQSIFGYDRPKMDCSDYYCHYVWPRKLLQSVDMHNSNYADSILALVILFFVFRIAALFCMSSRLKSKSKVLI